MTEEDYLILKNIEDFKKGRHYNIEEPEIIPVLEKITQPIPEDQVASSPQCALLTIEDLLTLWEIGNKTEWLKERHFSIYSWDDGFPSINLKSHKDARAHDYYHYGRCAYAPNVSPNGGLLFEAIAGGIANIDTYRQRLEVQHESETRIGFGFMESAKTPQQWNKIKEVIVTQGRKIAKNDIYEFEGLKWAFTSDGLEFSRKNNGIKETNYQIAIYQ